MKKYGVSVNDLKSSLLIENGEVYFKSLCALRLLRR